MRELDKMGIWVIFHLVMTSFESIYGDTYLTNMIEFFSLSIIMTLSDCFTKNIWVLVQEKLNDFLS